MKKWLLTGFLITSLGSAHGVSLKTEQKHIDCNQTRVDTHLTLAPQELIYKDTIVVSSNHPHIELTQWDTNKQAVSIYNKRLKKNTDAFDQDFTLFTTAIKKTDVPVTDASLHLTFATNKSSEPFEQWIPITFEQNKTNGQQVQTYSTDDGMPERNACSGPPPPDQPSQTENLKAWVKSVQKSLTHTDSWLLRILFALILGILLSLTPCIYPMIPITVGVLQSQGSKSVFKNFFLSFAYTLGISTTFALFGLLAATSGEAFGHMMGNPIFVIFIVALLAYFALSLFGLYNLYIPRFLQGKGSLSSSGSFLSIYMFGLISGSVASPCLSPGLALILTMVAAMANKLLGFLLLFAFGIGISTPLLIIGTFSGSINLLPKAGGWMLEVQKIFGFMLFGMCFYYLSNITPWWIILIMLTIFSLCSGLYYLRSASSDRSPVWKNIKNILGVTGIALSVYLMVESFQEIYYPAMDDGIEATWYTDYDKAVTDAKRENKKLFLDFWAPYCTLCKVIASGVLKNPSVAKVLTERYIVVSVNGNDADLEPFKTLKERYGIRGFPNLLIVDPEDGKELRRWRGEIEDEEISAVVAELNKYGN